MKRAKWLAKAFFFSRNSEWDTSPPRLWRMSPSPVANRDVSPRPSSDSSELAKYLHRKKISSGPGSWICTRDSCGCVKDVTLSLGNSPPPPPHTLLHTHL